MAKQNPGVVAEGEGCPSCGEDNYLEVFCLPGYHPAAGMHQVELSAHVAHDFDQLARALRQELPVREGDPDGFPDPQYRDWTTDPATFDVMGTLCRNGISRWNDPCGIDTEGSEAEPWSLQGSFQPGTGMILRADGGRDAIARFGRLLQDCTDEAEDFHVFLHNAMHDLPILRRMGIDLLGWGIPFYDTMVLAYHLCIEPQGLKALAWRHAGMRMGSYRDQVGPYTHEKALIYLAQVACDETLPRRDQWLGREVKDREMTWHVHTPTPIHKRAAKILKDVQSGKVNKDGELTDPYKRWYQIEPEDRAMAEAVYGRLTAATMGDIPLATANYYACRDADATRRVGPILLAQHRAVFGAAA